MDLSSDKFIEKWWNLINFWAWFERKTWDLISKSEISRKDCDYLFRW
jgi:hypothetical protein